MESSRPGVSRNYRQLVISILDVYSVFALGPKQGLSHDPVTRLELLTEVINLTGNRQVAIEETRWSVSLVLLGSSEAQRKAIDPGSPTLSINSFHECCSQLGPRCTMAYWPSAAAVF